jgi:hypothetical protein
MDWFSWYRQLYPELISKDLLDLAVLKDRITQAEEDQILAG